MKTITISGVKALRETAKALQCAMPDGTGTREVWVPFSQITEQSEVQETGDEGELEVTEWFAKREGLDDDD